MDFEEFRYVEKQAEWVKKVWSLTQQFFGEKEKASKTSSNNDQPRKKGTQGERIYHDQIDIDPGENSSSDIYPTQNPW